MAKLAGVDVLVYIGTDVVGGQSGATLNRSAETIDTTSKDAGGWAESIVGIKNWSIECEGFIVESDIALEALETAWNNRTTVSVEIRFPGGTGKKKYTGTAYVTEFPVEFPQDDAVTYKITLQGTGALTIGTQA